MHSIAWISRPKGQGPRDGEADFLICHPSRGLLVVEIKGGRIALDYAQREWTSTDRHGVAHPIQHPFEQARPGNYGILQTLRASPRWPKLSTGRLPIGYAAFFPDVRDRGRLYCPAPPAPISLTRSDTATLPPLAGPH